MRGPRHRQVRVDQGIAVLDDEIRRPPDRVVDDLDRHRGKSAIPSERKTVPLKFVVEFGKSHRRDQPKSILLRRLHGPEDTDVFLDGFLGRAVRLTSVRLVIIIPPDGNRGLLPQGSGDTPEPEIDQFCIGEVAVTEDAAFVDVFEQFRLDPVLPALPPSFTGVAALGPQADAGLHEFFIIERQAALHFLEFGNLRRLHPGPLAVGLGHRVVPQKGPELLDGIVQGALDPPVAPEGVQEHINLIGGDVGEPPARQFELLSPNKEVIQEVDRPTYTLQLATECEYALRPGRVGLENEKPLDGVQERAVPLIGQERPVFQANAEVNAHPDLPELAAPDILVVAARGKPPGAPELVMAPRVVVQEIEIGGTGGRLRHGPPPETGRHPPGRSRSPECSLLACR